MASGNIPGAIVGVANGAKNFLSVAEKYCENAQHEKDCERDRNVESDRHDTDSWDREY